MFEIWSQLLLFASTFIASNADDEEEDPSYLSGIVFALLQS